MAKHGLQEDLPKSYKEEFTLEHRKGEAQVSLTKFPDRIPIIVERMPGSRAPLMSARKFLVPSECMVWQLVYIIRGKMNVKLDKALFLFVDRTVLSSGSVLGQIYPLLKDEDGLLYVKYRVESSFG